MAIIISITKAVKVDIAAFTYNVGNSVTIRLNQYDSNGNVLLDQIVKRIEGDELAELLSDRPAWAPTKPAGVFRLSDLLAFLQEKGL